MKALVTGGGGFLGFRIVQMLHERGDEVTVLGRHNYPHVDKAGIPAVVADIRDGEALRKAFTGMDAVFHVAAIPGIWGRKKTFWEINVVGTRRVLEMCRRLRILLHEKASMAFLIWIPERTDRIEAHSFACCRQSILGPARIVEGGCQHQVAVNEVRVERNGPSYSGYGLFKPALYQVNVA